jgi:photosystem II stability/assembly factor-like uncharacterized protein
LAAIGFQSNVGRVYTSTNSGGTWNNGVQLPVNNMLSVASSADGGTLVACATLQNVYKSTDSGVTWSQIGAFGGVYLTGISISADGQVILVTTDSYNSDGLVRISRNGGQTWVTSGGSGAWRISGVMSSDGQHMALINRDAGQVYISHDIGETWTPIGDSRPWRSVTISDDGQKLAVAGQGTYIFTTIDGGTTWIPHLDDDYREWSSISGSRDGSKLVATVGNQFTNLAGDIYTSIDTGTTWVPRNTLAVWVGSASSADGSKVAFIQKFAPLYSGVWSA